MLRAVGEVAGGCVLRESQGHQPGQRLALDCNGSACKLLVALPQPLAAQASVLCGLLCVCVCAGRNKQLRTRSCWQACEQSLSPKFI